MTDETRPGAAGGTGQDPPPHQPDLQELARDWISLWQSELAALATDRELQEGWQTVIAFWAAAASALVHALPRERAGERPGRGAGAAAPPGAAAAAAAPDARDAEINRLHCRLAELEQRLAGLERDTRRDGGATGRRPRKQQR
jgi:hypothetical protein